MTPLMVAAVASFAVGCVLLFIYAACKASAEWQRAEAAWQEAEEQWSQTLGGHDDETPPVPRD